jgi:hypothetical protein
MVQIDTTNNVENPADTVMQETDAELGDKQTTIKIDQIGELQKLMNEHVHLFISSVN